MCHVADKTKPVTRADNLGAKIGESLMGDGTGLEIADLVRRVVNELQVADPAPMRFFEPLSCRCVSPNRAPKHAAVRIGTRTAGEETINRHTHARHTKAAFHLAFRDPAAG
jgi:hypothetical protein